MSMGYFPFIIVLLCFFKLFTPSRTFCTIDLTMCSSETTFANTSFSYADHERGKYSYIEYRKKGEQCQWEVDINFNVNNMKQFEPHLIFRL
jgi:hypothetical protein